jgi:hypothetical protein
MITEDNSKGVTSLEVGDVQACLPLQDEQTSRQDSTGQRCGSKVPKQVVGGYFLF